MQPATAEARTVTRTIDGLAIRLLRTRPPSVQDGDLPVLVLHGWGAHIEAVRPIVAGLEPHVEVIAVDLPGFGESAPPPEPWGVDEYAAFVLRLLDHEEIPKVRLVGHSNGGRIAIALATGEHAQRFDRLLFCDAAGIRPRRRPRYYWRVAIAKLGRVVGRVGGSPGRRLQDRMRRRTASADYLQASPAMRATFRAVIAQDLTDRLARIKAPTLLVWGERDDDTPLWMGERMAELIPDAGLVVFAGAGHYAYADDAARFNRLAHTFLVSQPRQLALEART